MAMTDAEREAKMADIRAWTQKKLEEKTREERAAIAASVADTMTANEIREAEKYRAMSPEEQKKYLDLARQSFGRDPQWLWRVEHDYLPATTPEAVKFEKENIQLRSGEWVDKKEVETLPEKEQRLLKSVGTTEFGKRKEKEYNLYLASTVELTAGGRIDKEEYKKLDEGQQAYVSRVGIDKFNETEGIDPTVAVTAAAAGVGAAGLAKEIGLSMIPVYGTYRYAQQAGEDGYSGGEIAMIAGSAVLDVLCIIPFVGGIAAGARAAKGIGTGARIAAIGKGIGQIAIAEVKAPYTILRHPLKTAKGMLDPYETLLHPHKVPLSGVEIREATVRLPVKAIGTEKEAMALRDLVTGKAIKGVKAVAEVGERKVVLARTAIQKTGMPVAIHNTPDIRPFLEGATVLPGREGGMFVSPNLHSRFTLASAFGDVPEGGIRGAIVITDKSILAKLIPSGKIFKGTAEIEKILPAGIKLPKPSQLLFTRDLAGERLVLAVYGKPFSKAAVAKMKIIGSVDLVKDIFINPAKISKIAVKEYDELNDLRKAITIAKNKAKTLRTQGKVAEAAEATKKAKLLMGRADRLRARLMDRLVGGASTATGLRMAALNFESRGTLEDWERVRGTRSVSDRGVRKLRSMTVPAKVRVTTTRGRVTPARVSRVRPPRVTPDITPPVRITRAIPRRPGAPRVPKLPGRELPLMPTIPLLTASGDRQLSEKERIGSVAWRQGMWYILIYPPYGQKEIIYSKEPFPGIKMSKGEGSAYRSIGQPKKGILPPLIQRDMGVVDVRIKTPKKGKPKISFTADPKQQTTLTQPRLGSTR